MPLLAFMHLLAVVSQPTATLHVATVAALIGLLIPLVTAVVVRKYADRRWFVLCTTALSVLTGGLAALVERGDAHTDWATWLLGMVTAFITAITSYYGIHLPVGTAAAIQNATADFGIGGTAAAPSNMVSVARAEYASPQGGVGATMVARDRPPDPPSVQSGTPVRPPSP